MELLTADSLEKVGIAACLAYSIYCNYKITGNHMSHNTAALTKLTDAINLLIKVLGKKK